METVVKENCMNTIKVNSFGILLCLLIAIPSFLLGQQIPLIGGPVFAILIGMICNQWIKKKDRFHEGVTFTSKKILQYAVILLGFGLNIQDVFETGSESLPIILSTITTSLIVSFLLSKLLKMDRNTSVLVGVGSSVCGGSAIAATSPVIGAKDEEIAQSISVIFLFNILAALIFPTLGSALGLSNHGFGIFAGSAVNDTSSVTATASAWDGIHGSNTLDHATIVKLTRTLAIIPITIVLAILRVKEAKKQETTAQGSFDIKKIFPFFILLFLFASLITSICNLPLGLVCFLKQLSKFFIIMAMAAIGFHTNLIQLVKSGGKPIFMGFCCWICITLVCLSMQWMLQLL